MKYTVHVGDVAHVLADDGLGLFDAVLSDPPYGLSFMGKGWDYSVPGPDVWSVVLNRLRPGASLFAFGGTRTFHRLVCAVEDAGFEIRDVLMWLYGSGFPKNYDISKGIDKAAGAEREVVGTRRDQGGASRQFFLRGNDYARAWDITAPATPDAQRFSGYGTALKPAYEPIAWGMKPRAGGFANNATEHGVAGINVDAGRVGSDVVGWQGAAAGGNTWNETNMGLGKDGDARPVSGRWPANIILDEALDIWHISRFYYCAKASRQEREAGLDNFRSSNVNDGRATSIDNAYQRGDTQRRNVHPTVKPIDLCRYLASMLLPPPREDGQPRRILVPFSGSGSEMIGCLLAGWDEVVGVELSPEYADIARARLEHWERYRCAESKAAEAEVAGQESLF